MIHCLHFSIEEGLRLQAMNRAHQRVRKHPTESDLSRLETASTTSNENTPRKRNKPFSDDSSTETSLPEGGPESLHQTHPMLERDPVPVSDIELIFRPLPLHNQTNIDHDASQTRYIKTTANATGEHLPPR